VVGGGVTVTGGTVTNTQAVLSVAVDPNAGTGARGLSVGAATLANCVTINPQPRATGCDTTRLTQAMSAVTQTITVTGQALAAASISPTTGSAKVTWRVASASGAQVLISVTVAASTYDPYSPPQASAEVAFLPIQGNGGGSTPGYRPPVHVSVPLTLSITPGPGEQAAAFAIVLDEII
jgi:hypothetical protein